jgi:tRNA pseudouridine32 synthase/23S rRNA pseudouridine746 synthase
LKSFSTACKGLTEILKEDLGLRELYSVHRLDTMTSGLLLFAKSRNSAKELSRQFQNRLVEKYYLAVSDRSPKKKQGLIIGDMEKARRGAWKLTRKRNNPAITQFFSYPLGRDLRLYALKPQTGKTHQLRVALKSIGAPVLGDPVYHKKESGEEKPDRGYLHSYALRFNFKGEAYLFVREPDIGKYFTNEAFMQTIKKCERPWELKWPGCMKKTDQAVCRLSRFPR